MNKFITVLLSILLFTACSNDSSLNFVESPGYSGIYDLLDTFADAPTSSYNNLNTRMYDESVIEESTSTIRETTTTSQPINESKKIIKEGSMEIWVKDIRQPKARVDSLLRVNGGYYAKETLQNNGYNNSYSLTIRIPAYVYEKVIAEIETGPGEIFNKSIHVKDITEEYVDIQTRLDNKRKYTERYRELLKKANSIKEILEIEENIRTLEEEIESSEGRIRYLTDQVNYSTLQLTIHQYVEHSPPTTNRRFFYRLKNALNEGIDLFVEIILFTVTIWPLWIVFGILFYLFKRRRNKKRNKLKE